MDYEENQIETEVEKFVEAPASPSPAEDASPEVCTEKSAPTDTFSDGTFAGTINSRDGDKEEVEEGEEEVEEEAEEEEVVEEVDFLDENEVQNVQLSEEYGKVFKKKIGEGAGWVRINKRSLTENLEGQESLVEALNKLTESFVSVKYDGERGNRIHLRLALHDSVRKADEKLMEEEKRMKNQLLKGMVEITAGEWKSFGSEKEILQTAATVSRPLIELEVETPSEKVAQAKSFETSELNYASLGPGRQKFKGVHRMKIDTKVQAVPELHAVQVQTDPGLPVNACTQYIYDLEETKVGSANQDLPSNYKFEGINVMENALQYNEILNLYTDDYPSLVKREEDTEISAQTRIVPKDSLVNVQYCAKKVAASIEWHPLWAGVVAVPYVNATRALMDAYPGRLEEFEMHTILIWRIEDSLQPRLILLPPQEVLVVKWNPLDPNVLIGGSKGGQVFVWDITGRLEAVEKTEVLTREEQRYRLTMRTLINWSEPLEHIKFVRPVVGSAISSSHDGAVTSVQWVSPYQKMNVDGRFYPVLDNKTSMQFMSCGEDGAVFVWDIMPPADPKEKKTNLPRFKILDRELKPSFILNTQKEHAIITGFLTDALKFDTYERVIDYKPIVRYTVDAIKKSTHKISRATLGQLEHALESSVSRLSVASNIRSTPQEEKRMYVFTEDADVIRMRWEGTEFDKGNEVPTEVAETVFNIAGVHDGPIVCSTPSPFFPEFVMTAGGFVFAIWSDASRERPVFWKTLAARITFCSWDPQICSYFRVTRLDGVIEIWDLLSQTDRPILTQNISGDPLTATSTQPLATNIRTLAIADSYNGIKLLPIPLPNQDRSEMSSMWEWVYREICLREMYTNWNTKYSEENKVLIKQKKDAVAAAEQEDDLPAWKASVDDDKPQRKKRTRFLKATEKSMKKEREDREKMIEVLLRQKNVDKDQLINQRKPLMAQKELEQEKRVKQKKRWEQREENYHNIMKRVFPDILEKSDEVPTEFLDLIDDVKEQVPLYLNEYARLIDMTRATIKKEEAAPNVDFRLEMAEAVRRRDLLDLPVWLQKCRQERYARRKREFLFHPPPRPPPLACAFKAPSLALAQEPLTAAQRLSESALKAGYPWQTEGGSFLPGGAVAVAYQFLRCTLHQLAPNGVFYQIFHTQVEEKERIEFFKGISQALIDFSELSPSTPLFLLLEAMNAKRCITPESVDIVCNNMAVYMEFLPSEVGPIAPGSPWSTLLTQMEIFFRRIVLMLPTLEEILAPVTLMPYILKFPGISTCKGILDPFSKILSYAVQNTVVDGSVVVELCQLCGRAFSRDREKLCLTRMLVIELVQALKFKTTMPDANFIMLLNFVIQDTGNCLVQTGVTCLPETFTAGTSASEIMRQHLADALDFLADFHTVSKIKSFCQGDTVGLNEDTLGGALKSGVAQYVSLEMSRGARDNRAVARHLPWLYNAPPSLQQGPKEFLECMGHVRLLSWLLLGGLFQSLSAHSPCTPVPSEASCHVADHIQVILAGFAEQSKASVLHMSSLFHAFILCQLWTVYLEAQANSNPPGSEPHVDHNTILFDFWGKVTPCILQLVAHSKVLAEMVNLHFLSLLEALLEVNASVLGKLMPLWTPVLYAHHTQLPGHLQVRLQNCRNFTPSTPTNNSLLAKWLQRLQFKMGQIELQSSAATQFYSV